MNIGLKAYKKNSNSPKRNFIGLKKQKLNWKQYKKRRENVRRKDWRNKGGKFEA
jgi:hypothetical protein